MIKEIEKIAHSTDTRLPLKYRSTFEGAKQFIDIINDNKIEIFNTDILVLAKHFNLSLISNTSIHDDFSEVVSVEVIGEDNTFDMHIPNGNSYVANGIICHNTINLSKDVSKEEVSELYFMAHKEKCKGVTIYRDGSRMGVLVSKDATTNKDGIIENHAPRREKVYPCDIHYSNIKNNEKEKTDQWIFLVGLLDDRPYEIFGGKRKNIEIPKKYKTGWITKNGLNDQGVRTYDLILGTLEDSDERMIIKDIANEFSPDASSYTRIISTMLRHGIPIKIITEQLFKDSDSHMFTFEKGASRALKKYIKDGEKANGGCPDCGGELTYEGGCVICRSCGHSKCQ